ncbi:hypothetical protein L9F63_026469, partial [Diploptera punctata]
QALILISHKMAARMNDCNQNDEIEEVWEVGCASLVPEKCKLKYKKNIHFIQKVAAGEEL